MHSLLEFYLTMPLDNKYNLKIKDFSKKYCSRRWSNRGAGMDHENIRNVAFM